MKAKVIDTINRQTLCSQVVRRFRSLPGFQLLNEEEFVRLIIHNFEQKPDQWTETNIQNKAFNIYSEHLYRAIMAEDQSTQEAGFLELSRYLFRMAYNFYLRQSISAGEQYQKAEDCTQSALEKIFKNIASLNQPISFMKWCSVILRNTCLEEVRSRKNTVALDERLEDSKEQMDHAVSSFNEDDEVVCLKIAISRLKPEYQQVVLLSYFSQKEDGSRYPDREIASFLKINLGNLYTIRSRALAALRKDPEFFKCIQNLL